MSYLLAKATEHRRTSLLAKSFLVLVQNMVHQTVAESRNHQGIKPGAKFRTIALNRFDSCKENVLKQPSSNSKVSL
jgi:hypothetical protein